MTISTKAIIDDRVPKHKIPVEMTDELKRRIRWALWMDAMPAPPTLVNVWAWAQTKPIRAERTGSLLHHHEPTDTTLWIYTYYSVMGGVGGFIYRDPNYGTLRTGSSFITDWNNYFNRTEIVTS